MKIASGTGHGAYMCDLSISSTLLCTGTVSPGLCLDTIGYAASRFISRSPALCLQYTRISRGLRLAKGKDRRPKHCSFTVPACLMELPGVWAEVRVTVTPEGVTVDQVGLYRTLEEIRPAAGSRSPRFPAAS